MTDRQISLAAQILRTRYELSKVISDENILNENVMSDATKKKMREAIDVSPAHFQVLMGDLRKRGFIKDGVINPEYIPSVDVKSGQFVQMLWFTFDKKSKDDSRTA